MARNTARALISLALWLGVWLVASPALAYTSGAAPLCDRRAAIGFAPAPIVDAPQTSIDVPSEDASCLERALREPAAHPGRAPSAVGAAPSRVVALPAPFAFPRAPSVRCGAPRYRVGADRGGVQNRVDRPPRS